MAEPKARAAKIEQLFPWLLHWTVADERIGGFRSDSYAVQTSDGLLVIDPVPVADELRPKLEGTGGILLTHGNHQRAAWRFRRELGARVFAPAGSAGLDEKPDAWIDEGKSLPGGLQSVKATGFREAFYLTFTHAEGTGVLFCGDLICQDPDGPYRFPVEPSYFDPVGGKKDAHRLLELSTSVLCAAHAVPMLDGCGAALRGAIDRVS